MAGLSCHISGAEADTHLSTNQSKDEQLDWLCTVCPGKRLNPAALTITSPRCLMAYHIILQNKSKPDNKCLIKTNKPKVFVERELSVKYG